MCLSVTHLLLIDMLELMSMNIRALYKWLEEEGGSEFGHLATMTSCAKGQLVPRENWLYMYLVELHIQQILPFWKRLY